MEIRSESGQDKFSIIQQTPDSIDIIRGEQIVLQHIVHTFHEQHLQRKTHYVFLLHINFND